ncbi:MAG: efflux RND transporter periplasmic adaptor subunit [Pseudomonadota bacterium]|nr:efflux RND transporter periplasmic adaptor subunit [Pseudomonadota bacterium]
MTCNEGSRRPRHLVWPLLLLTLAACGGETAEPRPAQDTARPVSVVRAGEQVLPRRGTAPAEVRSANESDLSADVSARVEAVVVEVGSTVARGDTLLRLDDRDYRLALEQTDARAAAAQARLTLATRRLERARTLLEGRYVSRDEVQALQAERDSAAADLRVAQADRSVAARNVAKTRIVAPFDGVVVERFAQVGTLAASGSPLLRMVQTEGIELEASIPSDTAAGLAEATQLHFEHARQRYPVRLLRLGSVVERAARTQVARLAFLDDPAPVGSAGTLVWQAPGQRLSPDLLVTRDGINGFFLVQQGSAVFRPVPEAQTGRAFDVAITPDALLVVAGQQALKHGDAVQVTNAPEVAEQADRAEASGSGDDASVPAAPAPADEEAGAGG